MNLHTGRRRFAEALDFRVYLLRHLHGVAFRLPIDAQQHRRLPVRGNNRIKRTNRRLHFRNVTHPHRHAGSGCLDDGRGNLLRIAHLSVDQPKVELMVAFEKAGRVNQVGAPHRFEEVGNRDTRLQEFGGIGDDMKLRLLATLHKNSRHAVQTVESWLKLVGGNFPKLRLWDRVGRDAVAENRKAGEGHAMRFHLRARRQLPSRA